MKGLLHFIISLLLVLGFSYILGPGIKDTPLTDYFFLLGFLFSVLYLLIVLMSLLYTWAKD